MGQRRVCVGRLRRNPMDTTFSQQGISVLSRHGHTTEVAWFVSGWYSTYFCSSEYDSSSSADYLYCEYKWFSLSPFLDRILCRALRTRSGQHSRCDLASTTVAPPIFLLRGLATAAVLQSYRFDVGGVWARKANWRFTSCTLKSVRLRNDDGSGDLRTQ